MVEVRAPRDGDIAELLANIRPQDATECEALLGADKLTEAVEHSVRASSLLWAAEAGGRLLALFGAAPLNLLTGQGAPWLVGTVHLDRHRSAFIRLAPTYIAQMLAEFPHLANVVDVRNSRSIAWLRRCGFTIHPPVRCGAAGRPFHLFTLDA